jgi:cytochrome c peroxidase
MTRALLLLMLAAPAAADETVTFTDVEAKRLLQHSPLPPPPADETNAKADDPRAAQLGRALFFDARLSGSGRLSCASCHQPERSWTDGLALAHGAETGRRHTPSLWNVAYNRWYFWDGRADSLWAQALQPIESAHEMAGSRDAAVRLVRDDASLRREYEAVFGAWPAGADRAAVTRVFVNLGKALAAFERTLVSRRSPFDVFAEALRTGDLAGQGAIGPAAQRGAKLFVGRGSCRVCHAGPTFSDGEFHDIGLGPARPGDAGRLEGIDRLRQGEFGAGSEWSDGTDGPRARNARFLARAPHAQGQFKTPTLRNVALTGPYMHDGRLASLADVLAHYSALPGRGAPGPHQESVLTPLALTPAETADLIAFLESLTDAAIDPDLLRAGRSRPDRRATIRR